jgi:protein O-GlcNAc transferase
VSNDIGQILQWAIAQHQAGRLAEAERGYRQVLALAPAQSDALHLLGVIAYQVGQHPAAVDLIRKAIGLRRDIAEYHNNLGNAYRALEQYDAAAVSFRKALSLKPGYPEALSNLGNVLAAQDKDEEAIAAFRRALSANPQLPEALNNLGTCLKKQGKVDEAMDCFRGAVEIDSNYAEALYNLGNVYKDRDMFDEALAEYSKALAVRPNYRDAWYNLANARLNKGLNDEAIDAYEKALLLKPGDADALLGMGNALRALKNYGEAEACFHDAIVARPDFLEAFFSLADACAKQDRFPESLMQLQRAIEVLPDSAEAHNELGVYLQLMKGNEFGAEKKFREALELRPGYPSAFSNLGCALQDQGRHQESEANFRRALKLRPAFGTYANLLFGLNYDPDKSAEEIFAVYREFEDKLARPHYGGWRPHANDRNPERRLKVAYVSPDFRRHSTRHFLEPLLANHDHEGFEVFAYAQLDQEDEFTARYRSQVDHWLNTSGLSDDALAERIRADGIDILVDLAGQTKGNRLLVFARQPAPVSVSWLGYGYTTGVSAIDYLLTDEASAPAGSEPLFAETPWRLATPGYAYRPAEGMGEVSPLPALQRGQVTFGTLTRSVRINHRVVRVWAEILKRLPNGRLVIDSRNYVSAEMQDALKQQFAAHGIGAERLDIGFRSPPWDVLRSMDIGLDCFPHNSGTTLFESLYLGVPFVTLAGRPSVGRLGSSILDGVGHPEWIAASEEAYIDKAVALATDLPKLAAIRAGLRGEMQHSPLMDEAGFARKVETAYRAMFKRWADRVDE